MSTTSDTKAKFIWLENAAYRKAREAADRWDNEKALSICLKALSGQLPADRARFYWLAGILFNRLGNERRSKKYFQLAEELERLEK